MRLRVLSASVLNWTTAPLVIAGAAAFTLVAILNCGGYRYGVGDQAFYVPAVVRHLDPTLFPRDQRILHVQDRLMLYDETLAGVSQVTGVSVPTLFFTAYLVGMVLLFGAILSIGGVMYRSGWAIVLLCALMTLRHRITQTGANSLEAYFQPRMLAFALGAWAVAAYLRGRAAIALTLVAVGFALHPTTAVWFGIWIAGALAVSERRWRAPIAALGALAIAMAGWAVTVGPLRGHLTRMDPLWASALAGKDYVFPSDWNASFWLVNLAYLGVAFALFRLRQRRGFALPRERGLVAGAAALVAVFLLSWPLMLANIALAVQLQTSRVFWLLDFLAAIYLAWWLSSFNSAGPHHRGATRKSTFWHGSVSKAVTAIVMALAVGRGVYVWRVEHAGSPLVQIGLPQNSWTDAMQWISRTPAGSHVLADPGHAWKYGTSVRVSGERDVFLEEVKDLALALYSREVAVEALRRIDAAKNFDSLTPGQLRVLAGIYDLDYLVAERDVDLPVVYRNDRFRVYALTSP